MLYTYPAIEAALRECGAGSTSVSLLNFGAQSRKPLKLCGTMPSLEKVGWWSCEMKVPGTPTVKLTTSKLRRDGTCALAVLH